MEEYLAQPSKERIQSWVVMEADGYSAKVQYPENLKNPLWEQGFFNKGYTNIIFGFDSVNSICSKIPENFVIKPGRVTGNLENSVHLMMKKKITNPIFPPASLIEINKFNHFPFQSSRVEIGGRSKPIQEGYSTWNEQWGQKSCWLESINLDIYV